jgi:hypothetical protein
MAVEFLILRDGRWQVSAIREFANARELPPRWEEKLFQIKELMVFREDFPGRTRVETPKDGKPGTKPCAIVLGGFPWAWERTRKATLTRGFACVYSALLRRVFRARRAVSCFPAFGVRPGLSF